MTLWHPTADDEQQQQQTTERSDIRRQGRVSEWYAQRDCCIGLKGWPLGPSLPNESSMI